MSGSMGRAVGPIVSLVPRGGGADDGAAISAAAAQWAGRGVALVLRGAFTLTTSIILDGLADLDIDARGATFACAIPVSTSTTVDCPIRALATGSGNVLTLAAPTVAGSRTLTVTTTTGLVVGGHLVIDHTASFQVQVFEVRSISGSSSPYTVTLDRPLAYAYPVSGTGVAATTPPRRLRLDLRGAVFTANASAARGRGVELSQAWECSVLGGTFTGRFDWGGSLDVGSYRSSVIGARVIGTSDVGTGWASESTEDCEIDVDVELVTGTGGAGGAGLYAYGSRGLRAHVRAAGCSIGARLDGGGSAGSEGCVLTGDLCGNVVGLAVYDHANGWVIRDARIARNSGAGVLVSTDVSGTPAGTVFAGCTIAHNGNNNVSLATGSGTTFTACTIGDAVAGAGVLIAAAATGTKLVGCALNRNPIAIESAGGVTATACSFADNTADNLYVTAGDATLNASSISVASGSATWHGVYHVGSGRVRVAGCSISGAGSTGTKLAIVAQGTGFVDVRQTHVASCSHGLYWNGGAGSIAYDESVTQASVTNPTTGTVTTTSSNEESLGA